MKVTGTLSYYRDRETNDPWRPNPNLPDNYCYNEAHFRITPAVQYEWFNRGLVTMYSDIGFTFEFSSKQHYVDGVLTTDGVFPYFRPNFTPFGITVGKKLFGFAELVSFGPRGFINAGIGYRF